MPLPSSFESELFCLMNQWKGQAASDYESISVSLLLAKQVDNIFFPNVRELLKILAVLPMGSTKAVEVVFSYSEDPYIYLASQHNDHRGMLLRFGRHRHACKYSCKGQKTIVSNTLSFISFSTRYMVKTMR